MKYMFNIVVCQNICESICFKLSLMLSTTRDHSLDGLDGHSRSQGLGKAGNSTAIML